MKLNKLFTLSTAVLVAPIVSASTSYLVDISPESTIAATGSDTYNTLGATAANGNANTLSTGGGMSGYSASNLLDSTGVVSVIDVFLNSYTDSTTGGGIRSNSASGGNLTHVAVAGVEEFASSDSMWINNHNSHTAGEVFGFELTFSDLVAGGIYNVDLLVASNNSSGTWSVTTGTTLTPAQAFDNDPSGPAPKDNQLSFANVVADGSGVITLKSSVATKTKNYENQSISFAQLTVVPEPSSALLLGLGSLVLLKRRRS